MDDFFYTVESVTDGLIGMAGEVMEFAEEALDFLSDLFD